MVSKNPDINGVDTLQAISLRAERKKLREEMVKIQTRLKIIDDELKHFDEHGGDGALDGIPQQANGSEHQAGTPKSRVVRIENGNEGVSVVRERFSESNDTKDQKSTSSPGFLKLVFNRVRKRGPSRLSSGHENDSQRSAAGNMATTGLRPSVTYNIHIPSQEALSGGIVNGTPRSAAIQKDGTLPLNPGPGSQDETNPSAEQVVSDLMEALSASGLGPNILCTEGGVAGQALQNKAGEGEHEERNNVSDQKRD